MDCGVLRVSGRTLWGTCLEVGVLQKLNKVAGHLNNSPKIYNVPSNLTSLLHSSHDYQLLQFVPLQRDSLKMTQIEGPCIAPRREQKLQDWLFKQRQQVLRLPDNRAKCSVFCCFLLYIFSQQEEPDGRGIQHVWRGEEVNLVGRPEGRRPLGRPKRGWEDNIKMDLQEMEWGGMDCSDLVQDRDRWRAVVNSVMNLWVP